MATIRTSHEAKRGCGFRQPGGLYLVSPPLGKPCGKLPIPLGVCPCCNAGIKPSRGWTWVNGNEILASSEKECPRQTTLNPTCDGCPLSGNASDQRIRGNDMEKVGLLWIGAAHYKDPDDFMREASTMGVSRRIRCVPKDYDKKNPPWVWLAHRMAMKKPGRVLNTYAEVIHVAREVGWVPSFQCEEGTAKATAGQRCAIGPGTYKPAYVGGRCMDCGETEEQHDACAQDQPCWVVPIDPKTGEHEDLTLYHAAAFTAFRPVAVEYIVKGDETEEELDALEKRGLSLVKVIPIGKQTELKEEYTLDTDDEADDIIGSDCDYK